MEFALSLAGDNRTELLKVIDHYQTQGDQAKLASAYFLIANMPGHYSSDDGPIRYFDTYFKKMGDSEDREYRRFLIDSLKQEGLLPRENLNYFYDIYAITADYLIDNIEISFRIWAESPWSAQYSFDQFCHYILPYKVNEGMPLENWKEKFNQQNKHYLDAADRPVKIEEVYGKMYQEITGDFRNMSKNFYPGPISLENLNRGKIGLCSDGCNYFAAMTRAIGIPTMVDLTPYWGDFRLGHEFNSLMMPDSSIRTHLYDEEIPQGYDNYVHAMRHFNDNSLLTYKSERRNKHFKTELLDRDIFNVIEVDISNIPKNVRIHSEKKVAKIFRIMYGIQAASLMLHEPNQQLIPPNLQTLHNKDVTNEYIKTANVEVSLTSNSEQKYLFLCVFVKDSFCPMEGSLMQNGVARFRNVGVDVVYYPMFYTDGKLVPGGNPFLLLESGRKRYFQASEKETTSITLDRKFLMPLRMVHYANKMVGGKFQVSNDSTFTKPTTILKIKKAPYYWSENAVKSKNEYRYVRLYNPENKGDMAELEFYTKTDDGFSKIVGTILHSDTRFVYPRERAFDGDMNSYIDNKEVGNWVGLDFGKPVKINRIRYCPRNDTNQIIPGSTYELRYWNDGWKSLKTKKATKSSISFSNVPKEGLLWLRNLNGGNEERPFVYKDGVQVFY